MIYLDYVTLSRDAQRGLIEVCALQMKVDPTIIEKDLWVVFVLSALFDRGHFYNDLNAMVFKGGTSLSKAYRAIERFSEDIDITVDRAILGWTASDEEFGQGSNNERKKALEELNKRGREFIEKHVLGYLQARLSGFAKEKIVVRFSEGDCLSLEIFYPSCLHTAYSVYIPQRVYVEFGFRGSVSPAEWINVRPYVHEKMTPLNDFCVPVHVLSPIRTFFEKVTLLHAEANRPDDKKMGDRLSRHYYDVYQLIEKGYLDDGVSQIDILQKVISHKSLFFPSKWASYDTISTHGLKLLPSNERLEDIRADYRKMNPMFFGELPSFETIMDSIKEAEAKLNKSFARMENNFF